MKIFETIERGNFLHYGKPDRVIDTMLSRLYFFGGKVLKSYKHIDAFYGNMADNDYRKYFHEADFFWNNYMAPEIYLRLGAVKGNGENYLETEMDEADDYYIEMAKIDDSRNLTQGLSGNTVSEEDITGFIDLMVEKLRRLASDQKERLAHISDRGWPRLFDENIEDLRNWVYLAEKDIPRSLADVLVDRIEQQVKESGYLDTFDKKFLTASIDNNCDNLLFLDGRPSFIDIMPPKESWRAVDEYWAIARTIADAYVLGSKELGEAAHNHYRKYRGDIPEEVVSAYETRAALLQATYRYILGQDELAERYMEFARKRVA